MTKFYPTRNDLDKPDKVERIVKDLYDKVNEIKKPSTPKIVRRINIHSTKS